MKKRHFAIFIFCLLLLLGISLLYHPPKMSAYCPFCDEKVVNLQKFKENDLAVALINYRQLFEGQCLIISKRHVKRFEELTAEEIRAMGEMIKCSEAAVEKVFGTKAYLLLQKNGPQAGQTVSHIHFHLIPRRESQTSLLAFHLRCLLYPFIAPLRPGEIEKRVKLLQAAT